MKTYSFIIPHHNTPDLLQRLISTIPQREDIEIIVVDDNSDKGKKANVVRPDVQLIFLDKMHSKGAGHARNVGIDKATGKWLLFADADDLYKKGFIKILDKYKNDDIEMLFYNIESIDSETLLPCKKNRAKLHQNLINSYKGDKSSSDELLYLGYSPWRRMFCASFIKRYNFQFEEICQGNDALFSIQTSYFATKWKVDKRSVYIVTYLKNSITYSNITKQKYVTTINNLIRRAEFNKFIGHPEWNINSVRGYRSYDCIRYLLHVCKRQPLTGINAFFYYIIYYAKFKRNANLYVDLIKQMRIRHSENKL